MLFPLIFSAVLSTFQQSTKPVHFGWQDEMNRQYEWKHLASMNKPDLDWSRPGLLRLTLHRVPKDWPYQYQWSGVTKTFKVHLGEYKLLAVNVTEVSGYAHFDIDVLDGKERVLKQIRSNTLQSPGICSVNLGEHILAGHEEWTLRMRLIVGGPNEGCSATYDWIRLMSAPDDNGLIP